MKKLILALTFITIGNFMLWGQQISIRFDGVNAFWGSDVNPPALNWKVGISDNLNYDSKFRFGMEYEVFNYIGYQQWVFAKFDYEIYLTDKIIIMPGIAISQIYHETSYSQDAFSYMFNLEFDYALNNWLKASVQLQHQKAIDIEQLWRDSAYIGIKYYW